ncbi:putative leucine-rich repeat receptor-like protein kinase [Quercus suber]|uniref:Leucine-rich repeat receptor-like protein kinase n=1 Tax=Quercus suber TaxID=58331 RepID=A0AAW0J4V7_QUESU
MYKHFLFALLAGFSLLLVHGQNQSGFISLDCGLPANSSYTEPTTGINYISDAAFIDAGVSMSISPVYKTNSLEQEYYYVRSFPQGIRNCYTISVTNGTRYLIRGSFLYANYDAKSKPPGFDLYIDANKWDSVTLLDESTFIFAELIHVPKLDHIDFCLVNTGNGVPFISALELRPLKNDTYVTESGSLSTFLRLDFGSLTNQTYRYKDDVFDRMWFPPTAMFGWTPISTSLTAVMDTTHNDFQPPSVVMDTASTAINASSPMTFNWVPPDNTSQYYVYIHIAEIKALKTNESRVFNISLNGELWGGPYIPKYLHTTTIYSPSALKGGKFEFALYKIEQSTLPPLINAIEVYTVVELLQSQTDQQDVGAIKNIKTMYGVTRNWQGDPCAPTAYVWDGLNCTYNAFESPTITSLNLSSSGLAGQIAPYISNLTMIQYLDLSNNSLTGPVPNFLSNLQSLRVLNLERNNLSGSLPAALLDKSKSGSLLLSVAENPNLCPSISCTTEQKKKNIIVPIVASIGGFFILLLGAAGIFWIFKRIREQEGDKVSNLQNVQLESKNRQFTYSDIQMITNNFEKLLGEGGFGKVYLGYVDGNPVAVKMISQSAVEGYQQFHSEACRPAIMRSTKNVHISQWINSMVAHGDIRSIVDPRLPNGDFDLNSAWKAVEVSMTCVSENPFNRPTMSQVVIDLKECLTTELAQRRGDSVTESNDSSSIFTINVTSGTSPSAR